MVTTLDQRLERVAQLRASGHNCSQCVMLAFADKYADLLSPQAAAALTCAYGGGVAGTGHICGAASSIASVVSLLRYSAPADKRAVYADGAEAMGRFIALQGGKSDCRDLRVPGAKPCGKLIEEAVTVLHKYLEEADAR